MEGWIKKHRCIMDKRIWLDTTPEQKVILDAILLLANHSKKEWEWNGKRYVCDAGQLITSLKSLADKCGKGISIQNVRTALNKFESFGFLTKQPTQSPTHGNTLITVVNWGKYQGSEFDDNTETNTVSNKELTQHQHITRMKECKNDNKHMYASSFESFWKEYPRKVEKANAYKCYNARLKDGFSEEDLLTACKNYKKQLEKDGTDKKYIKHPKTFLSANTPFLDYLDKKEESQDKEHDDIFSLKF